MLLNSAIGEGIPKAKQTKICYLPKCEKIRNVFLNSAAEKCRSLADPLLLTNNGGKNRARGKALRTCRRRLGLD